MQALRYLAAQVNVALAGALVAVAAGVLVVGVALWMGRKKRAGSQPVSSTIAIQAETKPAAPVPREADAIYQNDRMVGRVSEPEVDEAAKQIRFGEIYNSDDLLLTDECEFRKYIILIQKIDFASKIDRAAPHKGRVLRGVTADILGYREQ